MIKFRPSDAAVAKPADDEADAPKSRLKLSAKEAKTAKASSRGKPDQDEDEKLL